jgi:hypothetical protein
MSTHGFRSEDFLQRVDRAAAERRRQGADGGATAPTPQPGQHFQIYYDLVKTPPARADRLVPHLALAPSASDPQVDWASLHPRQALWSDLLELLGMSPRGKGPYDLALCPIVKD